MVESVYFGMFWSLFVTASAGELCTSSRNTNGRMYCPSSCCESSDTGTFCCDSTVGLALSLVIGVLALIGVIVLIAALCCCPKTSRHTGKDCHPARDISTGSGHGLETTTVTIGSGQAGYTNTVFPKQQLQASNIPADNEQKWEKPPPAYTPVIPG